MRLMVSLLKQLAYAPTDLFYWEGVLTEVQNLAERLREPVEWICNYLEARGGRQVAEIRYWYETLTARARDAAGELRQLAPWLAEPFETELRMCSSDGSMADLMKELYGVPRLGELPVRYQAIAGAIRHRLEDARPLHESTRRVLEELLGRLGTAETRMTGLTAEFERQAGQISRWVEKMDFAFLFDKRRNLLRIGWDADSEKAEQAHYDVLASEARSTVFVAIAKGDIPRDAWFRLQRKLTSYHGYRTLLSWSGTMFEYLMPCLYMKAYGHTLLAESLNTAVRVQQRYGRERNVPWGISESACGTRDHALNYQYRAFGVPVLAANPKLPEGLVVAPYATMLAAMVDQAAASQNLHVMASLGWMGRYGFYESMDYTLRPTLVRMYMVHHQAMGLMALSNALLGSPMQTRFHADPLVVATEYLLQERLPTLQEAVEDERLHQEATASPAALEAVTHPKTGTEYSAEAV
jgi:cyclic beta-1,2-glucan glucanotransferase